MKVWKKLMALLLAIGMTAGFVACGGDSDKKSGDNTPGGESGTPGGEYVGEEVSEAEFFAALEASCAATNFTAVMTNPEGVTTSVSADGKVYGVNVATNGATSYC